MILERGNMWDVFGKTDFFVITTNPVVSLAGHAVMGAGIALEAVRRYPSIQYDFAQRLEYLDYHPEIDDSEPPEFRYFGLIGLYDNQLIGYFMVKDHWKNQARLDYIDSSCKELIKLADLRIKTVSPGHYTPRIDLNFPGIGNGRLRREDVLPIIEQLPDNVHVWEYE
jgi:hypothetical protein